MATIVSAATGNFNSGATWVGGVVPTVGDVAQAAAGHVITINVNTTCDAIESLNTTGYFVLPDGITLNASVRGGNTTGTLQYSGTTSATINGTINNTQSTASVIVVRHTGTSGTLNINGSLTKNIGTGNTTICVSMANNAKVSIVGTVHGSALSGSAISGGTGVTLNIQGSVTAGLANSAISITDGTVTVIGNVTGGVSSSNAGIFTSSISANSSITVTGDVTGGSGGSGSEGIFISRGTVVVNGNVIGNGTRGIATNTSYDTNSTITVNGNVYGAGSDGIYTSAYVVINGDCYGANSGAGYGVVQLGTAGSTNNNVGRVKIIGNIYAGTNAAAIRCSSTTGAVILTGNIYDAANGRIALSDGLLRILNPNTHVRSIRSGDLVYVAGVLQNGTNVQLVNTATADVPSVANVRSGITYAGGTLTGTLAVPAAASVAAGVPVDNTVGTGGVLLSDFAAVTGAQIAAATTTP